MSTACLPCCIMCTSVLLIGALKLCMSRSVLAGYCFPAYWIECIHFPCYSCTMAKFYLLNTFSTHVLQLAVQTSTSSYPSHNLLDDWNGYPKVHYCVYLGVCALLQSKLCRSWLFCLGSGTCCVPGGWISTTAMFSSLALSAYAD